MTELLFVYAVYIRTLYISFCDWDALRFTMNCCVYFAFNTLIRSPFFPFTLHSRLSDCSFFSLIRIHRKYFVVVFLTKYLYYVLCSFQEHSIACKNYEINFVMICRWSCRVVRSTTLATKDTKRNDLVYFNFNWIFSYFDFICVGINWSRRIGDDKKNSLATKYMWKDNKREKDQTHPDRRYKKNTALLH